VLLTLSQSDYLELLDRSTPEVSIDPSDVTQKYPSLLGEGTRRKIELRDGLWLQIDNCQQHQPMLLDVEDRHHPVEFQFFMWGDRDRADEFSFYGSGMAPAKRLECREPQSVLIVTVHMQPQIFCAFTRNEEQQLPLVLAHLVRDFSHRNYQRLGKPTPQMQIAVRQILQCDYQGFTKQMYLESKVLELMSLLVAQEEEIYQAKSSEKFLKKGNIERIYYAKEILLSRLEHPPSLIELARTVGLNDRQLKQGFKQVFGNSVFGYLHHYRLELARKLLTEGRKTVTEVSAVVGYSSLPSFCNAFRKKFGTSPKSYK
jgi:AraC family transcriptional regulator, transcriptional activator of the genes for pyochelin and ferripyochelin receptors